MRSTIYHIALVTEFHLGTLAGDPDDSITTEADLARREGRDYEPASALLEHIRAERATLTGCSNRLRARWAQATEAVRVWDERDEVWQKTKEALTLFTPDG